MTLLAVERLEARHGQLVAVRGVSLSIEAGETVALVGANGAGKTTMLRTIAGAHRLAGGRILFKGRDVGSTAAHLRGAMGVALVPEGRRLFSRLTVEENLTLARSAGRSGPWTLEAVMEAFPNLKQRRRSFAGSLSGGEQQATAIGRALMMNPELLLLDEVSLGLAPVVIKRIYEAMEALPARGTTILVVEQDVQHVLTVADRVACFLEGRISLEGAPGDISSDDITAAYFGM